MCCLKIRRGALLIAAMFYCSFVTSSALAGPDNKKTVDCNEPNASVQKEVDKLEHGRDETIYIVGFCNESVAIARDGVTLSGNKSGNGTIGGGLAKVTVTGAQRVVIEYLKLTGPGYGVLVQEGASANIRNNNIHDNEADGVGVFNLAFARVEFNSITGNGRLEYEEAGIQGGPSATIRSRGNFVAENGFAAVGMYNNGYFRSGASGPDDRDVFVQKGCSQGQTFEECRETFVDGTLAIECFRGVSCDFRNTEVVGFMSIGGLSNFSARETSLNGPVVGDSGANLELRSSVSGSGDVYCFGEAFASHSIECGDPIPEFPAP